MIKQSFGRKLLIHIILLLGLGITIFPFFWMVLTSFKTTGEAMQIHHRSVFADCKFSSLCTNLPEHDSFHGDYCACTARILCDGRLCLRQD